VTWHMRIAQKSSHTVPSGPHNKNTKSVTQNSRVKNKVTTSVTIMSFDLIVVIINYAVLIPPGQPSPASTRCQANRLRNSVAPYGRDGVSCCLLWQCN